MPGGPDVRCLGCGRPPDEIDEYIQMARETRKSPVEFVKTEEGTYNSATGRFWCTRCYIEAGLPKGVAR